MTKPSTITIDDVKYVRADSVNQKAIAVSTEGLPYCIIRTRNAGVHAGYVKSRSDMILQLVDSRRIWQWASKATLSELSQEGPITTKTNKYGCVVPLLDLTVSDVCEVLYCTNVARQAIENVAIWVA